MIICHILGIKFIITVPSLINKTERNEYLMTERNNSGNWRTDIIINNGLHTNNVPEQKNNYQWSIYEWCINKTRSGIYRWTAHKKRVIYIECHNQNLFFIYMFIDIYGECCPRVIGLRCVWLMLPPTLDSGASAKVSPSLPRVGRRPKLLINTAIYASLLIIGKMLPDTGGLLLLFQLNSTRYVPYWCN